MIGFLINKKIIVEIMINIIIIKLFFLLSDLWSVFKNVVFVYVELIIDDIVVVNNIILKIFFLIGLIVCLKIDVGGFLEFSVIFVIIIFNIVRNSNVFIIFVVKILVIVDWFINGKYCLFLMLEFNIWCVFVKVI